jgi:hypothetical protein
VGVPIGLVVVLGALWLAMKGMGALMDAAEHGGGNGAGIVLWLISLSPIVAGVVVLAMGSPLGLLLILGGIVWIGILFSAGG